MSVLVNAGRDSDAAARYRAVIDGRSVVVFFVTVTQMRFGAIKAGWGEIRCRHLRIGLNSAYALTRQWRLTGGREGLGYVSVGRGQRIPKVEIARFLTKRPLSAAG